VTESLDHPPRAEASRRVQCSAVASRSGERASAEKPSGKSKFMRDERRPDVEPGSPGAAGLNRTHPVAKDQSWGSPPPTPTRNSSEGVSRHRGGRLNNELSEVEERERKKTADRLNQHMPRVAGRRLRYQPRSCTVSQTIGPPAVGLAVTLISGTGVISTETRGNAVPVVSVQERVMDGIVNHFRVKKMHQISEFYIYNLNIFFPWGYTPGPLQKRPPWCLDPGHQFPLGSLAFPLFLFYETTTDLELTA